MSSGTTTTSASRSASSTLRTSAIGTVATTVTGSPRYVADRTAIRASSSYALRVVLPTVVAGPDVERVERHDRQRPARVRGRREHAAVRVEQLRDLPRFGHGQRGGQLVALGERGDRRDPVA